MAIADSKQWLDLLQSNGPRSLPFMARLYLPKMPPDIASCMLHVADIEEPKIGGNLMDTSTHLAEHRDDGIPYEEPESEGGGAPGNDVRPAYAMWTKELRKKFRNGLRGACVYCGERRATVLDHVHPVCRGGTFDVDNIVPACQRCNGSKHTRDWMEWSLDRFGQECLPAIEQRMREAQDDARARGGHRGR